MNNMKRFEENINLPAKTRPDVNTLSLDELIGGIDKQLEKIAGPELGKDMNSQVWERATTHLQNQFIRFALENTVFALPLSSALEIGHRPNITRLPNLPDWVLGISNVRGEIISFVNLKAFLGIPSSGAQVENRFVIIHNHEMKVGIIVDQIMGIVSLDRIDTDIQSSPYREGEIANYISGVSFAGEQLLNILAIDKLLSSPRLTDFEDNYMR
jgi:purine-binding chemotaxis protein CheW